ncbi:MAG: ferrochelatase, partial [bacterium]
RGILLVNTGSPDSPEIKDVRRYLGEFLMDKYVMDVMLPLRFALVRGIILPTRPRKSAEAYRSIWREDGSPLVAISRSVRARVQEGVGPRVALGMRYGNPSIRSGLLELLDPAAGGVDTIRLIPLFPHYAMSTTGSVIAKTRKLLAGMDADVRLEVLPPFYEDETYIDALTSSIRDWLDDDHDHVLFSYHGLPERHLRKTDPTGGHCLRSEDCCQVPSPAHKTCYRHQVFKTTEMVAARLGLPTGRFSVAFQSRLGRDRWLTPNTSVTLRDLSQAGVKKLLVVCPSFVTDCLETLEEIGLRGRRTFESAGGGTRDLVPCLNDGPQWIRTLQMWCA